MTLHRHHKSLAAISLVVVIAYKTERGKNKKLQLFHWRKTIDGPSVGMLLVTKHNQTMIPFSKKHMTRLVPIFWHDRSTKNNPFDIFIRLWRSRQNIDEVVTLLVLLVSLEWWTKKNHREKALLWGSNLEKTNVWYQKKNWTNWA